MDEVGRVGLRQRGGAHGLGADPHVADDDGVATCTYDKLTLASGLSRTKVANGLSVLASLGVIERQPAGRSTLQLSNFGNGHSWSKLPARKLYSGGRIVAFQHFTLRSMSELHALKLYYLIARRRSNETNMAHLSYDKIEEYAAIERHRIKAAISVLLNAGLAHVERPKVGPTSAAPPTHIASPTWIPICISARAGAILISRPLNDESGRYNGLWPEDSALV